MTIKHILNLGNKKEVQLYSHTLPVRHLEDEEDEWDKLLAESMKSGKILVQRDMEAQGEAGESFRKANMVTVAIALGIMATAILIGAVSGIIISLAH